MRPVSSANTPSSQNLNNKTLHCLCSVGLKKGMFSTTTPSHEGFGNGELTMTFCGLERRGFRLDWLWQPACCWDVTLKNTRQIRLRIPGTPVAPRQES